MALTHGMNVEAVRGIAGKLDNQAAAIHQTVSQVDSAVNQSQQDWFGKDAKQFADAWQHHYRKSLCDLENSLRELARSARQNADQQEHVSGS